MSKLQEVIRGIDWKALQEQKSDLVFISLGEWPLLANSTAEALLNLLDHIQDAAVADGLADESVVFPD